MAIIASAIVTVIITEEVIAIVPTLPLGPVPSVVTRFSMFVGGWNMAVDVVEKFSTPTVSGSAAHLLASFMHSFLPPAVEIAVSTSAVRHECF